MANITYKVCNGSIGRTTAELSGDQTLNFDEDDHGALLYNSAASTVTLPAIGSKFFGEWVFIVNHASNFKIQAPAGVTIEYGGETSAATGYIVSNNLNDKIVIIPNGTTSWEVISLKGNWDVDGASVWSDGVDKISDTTGTVNAEIADNNTKYTNSGGSLDVNLPAAVPGLKFKGYVSGATFLKFICDGTDTARYKTSASDAGGYFRSNTVGNSIQFECWLASKWYVTSLDAGLDTAAWQVDQ